MVTEKPLLQFKDASLGYGRRAVLTGVSLAVRQGAFIGILGPNGAGKTTLLKTLLGLIPPLKGGLSIDRPRYGYVPQKEKLDPIYPLSAYEVAAMVTGRGREDAARRALRECGAAELAGRRYSDLSGGQRQRVLIARALAAEPEFLVLDEPLAGIDANTQKALLTLFRELKEGRKLTVLMVSHRLQGEKDIFTDIAWVDEGRVQFGPTEKMLANRDLKEFFGKEA